MLRDLSSRQIAEWMAFDIVEPFGGRAEDLRSALVTASINNRLRGKDEPGHQVQEFQLHEPRLDLSLEPDEVWDKLTGILAARGD